MKRKKIVKKGKDYGEELEIVCPICDGNLVSCDCSEEDIVNALQQYPGFSRVEFRNK